MLYFLFQNWGRQRKVMGRKTKKRTEITEKLSSFFDTALEYKSNTEKVKIHLPQSKISLERKGKHPLKYA